MAEWTQNDLRYLPSSNFSSLEAEGWKTDLFWEITVEAVEQYSSNIISFCTQNIRSTEMPR